MNFVLERESRCGVGGFFELIGNQDQSEQGVEETPEVSLVTIECTGHLCKKCIDRHVGSRIFYRTVPSAAQY